MSEHKLNKTEGSINLDLNRVALGAAIIASLLALAGAWLLLPYRMDAVEHRTAIIETKLENQQQLLIRIDENVKQLKEFNHAP